MIQRLRHCAIRFGVGLLGGLLMWVVAGSLAYADHFPAEAVSTTKHNLAQNPNILFGSASTLKGGSEVCVYCHTPHGAGYAGLLNTGFPPLWNRKINTDTAYQTYDQAGSPSFEASSATTLNGKVKGVSLACLSCHDGTIAFDALINLQGSGGYVPGNSQAGPLGTPVPGDTTLSNAMFGAYGGATPGGAVDGNRTFKEGNRPGATTIQGQGPFAGATYTNDTLEDLTGGFGAQPFPNLGTDLRDDHPISFQIPCGTVAVGCDPQFGQVIAGAEADPNGKLLYLKRDQGGGGIYPQDKRDRIRAYASDGGTVATGSNTSAYIECASCHNPHTPRTLFLRLPSDVNNAGVFADNGVGLPSGGGNQTALSAGIVNGTYWSHAPNQASAICLSCHQK
ncbi:MAG TPA: hypothetical protein VLY45_03200 [Nitrospiria bacterium]|nr:hypothetical protein [Nitrospiria bacterium]